MRALPPRPASADIVSLGAVKPNSATHAWRRFATPTALAASMLVAFVLGRQVAMEHQERRQLAGIEASRKLMQALRVTSQKLDLAYEAVQREPVAPPAEENRS
jgi:hypothetical protein